MQTRANARYGLKNLAFLDVRTASNAYFWDRPSYTRANASVTTLLKRRVEPPTPDQANQLGPWVRRKRQLPTASICSIIAITRKLILISAHSKGSGCCDKQNCSRWDSNLGPLTRQSLDHYANIFCLQSLHFTCSYGVVMWTGVCDTLTHSQNYRYNMLCSCELQNNVIYNVGSTCSTACISH